MARWFKVLNVAINMVAVLVVVAIMGGATYFGAFYLSQFFDWLR